MALEGYLASVASVASSLTPRLLFRIELEKTEPYEMRVFGISGNVHLRTSKGFVPFGSLTPLLRMETLHVNRPRRLFELTFDLDNHKLEIIEEERKGSDLWLKMNVHVLYFDVKNQPFHTIIHGDDITIRSTDGSYDLRVPQSEWVKMLEQMGYRRFRMMEIPVPKPPLGTVIDSALAHIDEAKKSFDEGDYDDVLSNCRKAVEEIEKAIREDKINLNVVLDQSASKVEKLKGIEKKIKDFLNLGVHAIEAKIDRRDAEMALSSTISLTRYIAKKLIKIA